MTMADQTSALPTGTLVYHPEHGIGRYVGTETISGTRCHQVDFPRQRLTVSVPEKRVRAGGLPTLTEFASPEKIKRVHDIVAGRRQVSKLSWRKRSTDLKQLIVSPDIEGLATALRDLTRDHDDSSHVYQGERELRSEAATRLCEVIAAIEETTPREALRELNTHIAQTKQPIKISGW
jgi:RNA polymerase-interacting CarD/CdnL/TRCF family regulator